MSAPADRYCFTRSVRLARLAAEGAGEPGEAEWARDVTQDSPGDVGDRVLLRGGEVDLAVDAAGSADPPAHVTTTTASAEARRRREPKARRDAPVEGGDGEAEADEREEAEVGGVAGVDHSRMNGSRCLAGPMARRLWPIQPGAYSRIHRKGAGRTEEGGAVGDEVRATP